MEPALILSAIHGPLYAWPGWALSAWTLWCFAYLVLAPRGSVIPQGVDIHPLASFHNIKMERLENRPSLVSLAIALLACATPGLNLLFLYLVVHSLAMWRKHGHWRDEPLPNEPGFYDED